jgi:antitoxin component YwqK of YwqJK toxin-antitoxin module
MNHFLKLLFFLIPLALQAQTPPPAINPNGYNTFYYDNGKVSSEGTLKDGKPDGYWKTYYLNGKIKSEGNRKDFKLDGVWKFYNEDGILINEFVYKDGKKNGPKKIFDYKEGFITLLENYENDIKQGNTIEYYEPLITGGKQGKVQKIIPFVNGLEEGKGLEFSPDSIIITITQYKMGYVKEEERINRTDLKGLKQGAWKEFYPKGTVLKTEMNYWNDKLDGYLKEYTPKGSFKKATKYVNGVEQIEVPELQKADVRIERYKNGVVKKEGPYVNGKAEGEHREYTEDGQLQVVKVYSKGTVVSEGIIDTSGFKQGLWKLYYTNGAIRANGKYLNNKHIGDWTYYYADGKIEQIGKYDDKGRAQGLWKWYYPCTTPCNKDFGNLKKTEHYINNKLDGDFTEYSDSGKVITKGQYAFGDKEGPWVLEYNEYKEEGSYTGGKRSGDWKHYYLDNGKLRFKGSFVDDEPDGMQVFYYKNGNKKQEGKYAGGLKDGTWEYYDENGGLILTIRYSSGIEINYDTSKAPNTPQ